MLAEAFGWWTARMAELLPRRLVRGSATQTDALIVVSGQAPGSPAMLLLRRNGQEAPLGVFIPGSTDRDSLRAMLNGHARKRLILLRPPPGTLLEKRLVLPAAAEHELRHVIGYDMNR